MKPASRLLMHLMMLLVAGCTYAAQPSTSVVSKGETRLMFTAGHLSALVRITTHEMQIGKASDHRSAVVQSNCTYSRHPCSIVDRIDITVNGNPLFIPRSVFCGLADLNRADVKVDEERLILTLYGGDASESFIAKIEFDEARVMRRTILVNGNSGFEPSQETVYHTVILGD
ncbi:MAG: hypothetical protein ACOY3V_08330 [Pseudomonadota bacterium]